MKFWKRSGSSQSAEKRSGSSTSTGPLSSSLNRVGSNGALSQNLPSITKQSTHTSPPTLPSRKQRMQLLKCIIHHADAVQKQYLVPKKLPSPTAPKPSSSAMSIDNMSSLFTRSDSAAAEINDKCYQRWHQVLQEMLVTSSVHALNLLEKSPAAATGDVAVNDEEEAYFATMEGMDDEIRVMAILARAAALNDAPEGSNDAESDGADGMEKINAMMKCTAMLIFHIVLAASSPGSPDGSAKSKAAEAAKADDSKPKPAAGYDGRVRHVMKLACVDVLSRAILDGVEAFDESNVDDAPDNEEQTPGPYDMDEYTAWNIPNLKAFLDQTDLGKDAVFGTPFEGSAKKLLEDGHEDQSQKKKGKRQSQSETDEQTVASDASSHQLSQSEADEKAIDSVVSSASSSSFEVQSEQVKESRVEEGGGDADESSSQHSGDVIGEPALDTHNAEEGSMQQDGDEEIVIDNRNEEDGQSATNEDPQNEDEDVDSMQQNQEDGELDKTVEELQNELDEELRKRRQSNSKFLATRKFELIERLVAIDVVRFLMAEEREKKLREQEMKEQNKANTMLSSLLRRGNDNVDEDSKVDGSTADDGESKSDDKAGPNSDQEEVSSSQYLTASRIKSIKRGAKIAGAGLALGTVFAITGGLAAPALAAGISGIAALTGATTASSTALLAVLATFKAGAALFGVGGGGLAAYKMKKRTAGLSDFEIRRENIEQYMYEGASDANIKRGIETMLPQLHTTVAVSGWLREQDIADFQLAWGIQPTCQYEDEKADDKRRIRQMKRFYSIHNPPLVHLCEDFMQALQKRLKKDFSWDRIWDQLEQKYGANPDHMIPINTPHESEVFLSYEEKEMIDGVLNNAKIVNLKKRGYGAGDKQIDFGEEDEIAELLAKVSPKKSHRKVMSTDSTSATELAFDAMESELVTALESDLALSDQNGTDGDDVQANTQTDEEKVDTAGEDSKSSGSSLSVQIACGVDGAPPEKSPTLQERMAKQREQQASFLKTKGLLGDESKLQHDDPKLSVKVPSGYDEPATAESCSPSLQERMAKQREQQVSFLKDKGLLHDESKLHEGAGSPKMVGSDDTHGQNAQDPPANNEDLLEEHDDGRCPVVWDWTRLYGTADIHTVTWESDMLSSLCHIVENMALEVSSQATKVALQYSVIGAIISAVAIPSALVTASKLIDDPYQIVVIRADEAGKELAKCLLQSDERRPVTLVGFSFGARVVYSCLRELARQQEIWEENRAPKSNDTAEEKKSSRSFMSSKSKEERQFKYDREPASLVGDVVFIGLPRAIDKKVLLSCRRVTGGRLVNCYTRNDWLLSLMFVARGGTPCGTRPIQGVPGVENYDVTRMVESHTKYADAIPNILQHVRFTEP